MTTAQHDPEAVLLCGDVHGAADEVEFCLRRAHDEACQAVFFLGDFGYWEHERSGVDYLDEVEALAARHELPVYFLDGNHDKVSLLLASYPDTDDEGFNVVRPHVRYSPRGHRWTWSGVRFLSFGGAYSTDKDYRLRAEHRRAKRASGDSQAFAGTLWFPEEEAADDEVRAALDGPPIDVLLTHDKPRSSTPRVNRKDERDAYVNQERIDLLVRALGPTLLAHGHLHYRYTQSLSLGDRATRVEGLACDRRAAWSMLGYRHEQLCLAVDLAALLPSSPETQLGCSENAVSNDSAVINRP